MLTEKEFRELGVNLDVEETRIFEGKLPSLPSLNKVGAALGLVKNEDMRSFMGRFHEAVLALKEERNLINLLYAMRSIHPLSLEDIETIAREYLRITTRVLAYIEEQKTKQAP